MWRESFPVLAFLTILIFQLSTLSWLITMPSVQYGNVQSVGLSEAEAFVLPEIISTQLALASVSNNYDSMLIVGDVLLARYVETLMTKHGDDYPFTGISFSDFSQNPAVLGNFEAAVPKLHVPTPPLEIRFSVAEEYLPALSKAGFSQLSLANNHAFDFGVAGYENTQDALKEEYLEPFGSPVDFSPKDISFQEIDNLNVALIPLHALYKLPTGEEIEALFEATSSADFQLVYVHWGTEYKLMHSAAQENLAKKLVEAGADLIVGHHPHVVQDVQLIDGVPVFYSLGNYIFDQYFSIDVQESLMLQLDFSPQPLISLFPVTSVGSRSKPRMQTEEEKELFLEKLAARSDSSLEEEIMNGHLMINNLVASSTRIAMINK